MIRQYTDDDGNFIAAVSSTIPGLTIVPPGKSIEDGRPVTKQQVEKAVAKRAAMFTKEPELSIQELTKQLKLLQAAVDKLMKTKGE